MCSTLSRQKWQLFRRPPDRGCCVSGASGCASANSFTYLVLWTPASGRTTTAFGRCRARTECRRPNRRRPRASWKSEVSAGRSGSAAPFDLRRRVARTKELYRVGDDIDRLALRAVLGLPLAPVEAAVDRHRAALCEVLGAVLALRAPDRDVEVVGLVDPLPALASLRRLLTATRRLQTEVPPRRGAQLGVARQVAGDRSLG